MRLQSLRRSLRTRIIAWSFVPTVIILSLVALFVYQTYQRVIESQVFERDRQLTALRAQQMAAQLTGLTDVLSALAATPDIYRFEPAALRITLSWSINRLRVFDGGVLVVGKDGAVLAADPRRADAEAADWTGRPYLAALAQHQEMRYSDVFADGPGGASVAVGVPIWGEGQRYQGMLVGILRLAGQEPGELQRLLLRTPADPSTFYVVDARGQILYHHDRTLLGADASLYPAVRQAVAGGSGSLHTVGLAGREILATYSPLPGTTWHLIQEDDWAALAASYQGYERTLLVLLALALLIPAAVVATGVRRITRPIADLTRAADAVAAGQQAVPLAVNTGDELEKLARQFNAMSAQIKESYELLERRVADRTRELTALNTISALISRSLDLEEILSTALGKTLEVLELPAGCAYRLDEDGQTLALVADQGLPSASIAPLARLPLSACPVAAGSEVRAGALTDWPPSEFRAWAQAEGWQSILALPLVAKSRLLGTMVLLLPGPRPLAPEETSLLAAIGQQTGVALENAGLYLRAEQAAVAAERNRLARELHDSVTQTLFSANILAGVVPALWQRNPEAGQRRLEELQGLTQGALAEMRTLLLELRPAKLAETPLGDLLQQLAAAASVRARAQIDVEVRGQVCLPPDVQIALYRIAQEALNNLAKYAQAQSATVSLRCGIANDADGTGPGTRRPQVILSVRDDGCGFDVAAVSGNHLGLGIMRERAAAIGALLEIDSRPGGGTRVQVSWRGQASDREDT